MKNEKIILIIGLIGSFISSIRLIPQVYKSLKTHHVGLSMTTLLLDLISCLLFLIYSFYYKIWPFIFCNIVSVFSVIILIGVVLRKRLNINKKNYKL